MARLTLRGAEEVVVPEGSGLGVAEVVFLVGGWKVVGIVLVLLLDQRGRRREFVAPPPPEGSRPTVQTHAGQVIEEGVSDLQGKRGRVRGGGGEKGRLMSHL